EPLGDRRVEPAGLAVALVGRPGEHVDLTAAVVDVVFARHGPAGEGEQPGEGVAEDRAAGMPDVHRPGRVGGDELDVDLAPAAEGRAAEAAAGGKDRRNDREPARLVDPEVEEARA